MISNKDHRGKFYTTEEDIFIKITFISIPGDYGFILPVSQINETGAEFLAALRVVTSYIIEESKNDSYFNKPKQDRDADCVDLQNILRRKTTDTNSNYQLSETSGKTHPETPASKTNLSSTSSAITVTLLTRLLTIYSVLCATTN